MYDDNYAAAAAAVRAGQADEDEDDFILQQDPDKPGFVSWAEALSTRHFSQVDKCSVGYWDEAQNAVALTKCRGKKQLVMGYSIGGTRYLDPDEALYLVDDGQLMLLAWHPETGADLRPGMSRVAALTATSVESSDVESSRGPTAAAAVSAGGGSAAGRMAVDDASSGAADAAVAPAAAAGRPAGAPPKWKSNDDLMEHLERQMDEDEDGDADVSAAGGSGAGDDGEDEMNAAAAAADEAGEEDSYDEEEEAEMRGAVASGDARKQSAPQAASGDAVASTSSPAAVPAAGAGKDGYLPLPSAYAFLLQHVRLPEYLVYLHLRSTGLVALRHRPQAQAAEPVLPAAAAAAVAVMGAAADAPAGAAVAAASDAPDDATAPAAQPEAMPLTPAPVLLHAAGQERWLAAPATPASATASGSVAAPSVHSSPADRCSSCAQMPLGSGSISSSAAGARGSCAHCGRKSTSGSSASSNSASSSGGGRGRGGATASASRWVTSVEPDVQPVYDAYARDGITSFKPSAPGPPDFYVCVQTADQPPPTPAQVLRLSERLARHMAALRERQRARGVACLPSFSEVGGGGGVSGAMLGKGASHMSRVGTGGSGAGGASADGSAGDAAASPSAFSPNIKVAIVAHTAITFFTATPVELRLPQRFLPRMGGAPLALVSGAAAMAAPASAEAAAGGAQASAHPG